MTNMAFGRGGAIWHRNRELLISNCTGHGNRSAYGRFLYSRPFAADSEFHYIESNAIIQDCILDNGGDEIWGQSNMAFLTIQYSDIPDKVSHETFPVQEGFIWGLGNRCSDPCFVAPGHWDDSNTPDDPNDDFYVTGDYHLKSQAGHWDVMSQAWVMDATTSYCIDTGAPNLSVDLEPLPHGNRINMGVYGRTAFASRSFLVEVPDVNCIEEPNVSDRPGGGGHGGR